VPSNSTGKPIDRDRGLLQGDVVDPKSGRGGNGAGRGLREGPHLAVQVGLVGVAGQVGDICGRAAGGQKAGGVVEANELGRPLGREPDLRAEA
jgi:hypothetical protein